MRNLNRSTLIWLLWLAAFAGIGIDLSMAEDWPGFRGPTGQGISHEKDLPVSWSASSNVVWKTAVEGEGWSSPIVFADNVFVTTATEGGACFRLLCLDRKNGEILWNKEVLRQEPGHKSGQNSYASSTPVSDGQRVYILAFDGSFAAVSMKGDVVWVNRDFKFFSEHGLAVSPILYKDLLIAPLDGSSPGPDRTVGWQKAWDKAVVVALDKNTGKVRWKGRRGLSRISHITPLVVSEGGEDRLISSAGDVVQGFDLDTGERLWTASNKGEGVVPSLVEGDGLVFATSGFGDPTIRAIRTGGKGDVTKTHIVWESKDDVSKIPSMLYVKPFLFAVTEAGVATCMKGSTGEVLWRERLGGRYSASPVWADGRIYFLSEKGVTTVIEAGPEFEVVGRSELGEKCCATPAFCRKQIFIRTEQNLYCIGQAQ
jgi:outer membrane protein assembly factor BamB